MKPIQAKLYDFFILALRWYLAYYMADYGITKIVGGQFGHRSVEVLNMPLKDVDKFNLAWHLFSLDKTFDIIVGISQIVGALLIVFNRTVLAGALFLLPVLVQIFLIDVAFTTGVFGPVLPVRLACMILSDLLILYYYKDRMVIVWNTLTNGTTTRFRYKWWVFILMPVVGLAMDLVFGILTYPVNILIHWLMK